MTVECFKFIRSLVINLQLVIAESNILQPNGADQLIDEHHSNQSAQSGEVDAHKSDQVDQSDQLSATEDSAAVTSSEDTTAQPVPPPEEPQEVRGHVVSDWKDQFGGEDDICLLSEEDTLDVGDSIGGGGGLDDLGDQSGDLHREVPTNKEETPLSHRQEEDTTKGRLLFEFWCDSIKFPQEVIVWWVSCGA